MSHYSPNLSYLSLCIIIKNQVYLTQGVGVKKAKKLFCTFSPTLEVKSLLPGSPVVDLS